MTESEKTDRRWTWWMPIEFVIVVVCSAALAPFFWAWFRVSHVLRRR